MSKPLYILIAVFAIAIGTLINYSSVGDSGSSGYGSGYRGGSGGFFGGHK